MADIPKHGLDEGREALRRFLTGDDDLTTMLGRIALIATETVPGCDLASITMVRNGEPRTPVFTDKPALVLDETQYSLGDGPCLAAIRHRGLEHVDLTSDTRWPALNDTAGTVDVRSCLSVPLGNEENVVGSLNLYSRTTVAYDEEARRTACLFADQLGVAAANATTYAEAYELAQQLQRAMDSRAVIEQAKGILMEAQACSPEEAFEILVSASQHQNRKLRAIAAEIVERRGRKERADEWGGS